MESFEIYGYMALATLLVCFVLRVVLGIMILVRQHEINTDWIFIYLFYHEVEPSTTHDSDDEKSSASGDTRDTISIYEEDVVDTTSLEWIMVTSSLLPPMGGEWREEFPESDSKNE